MADGPQTLGEYRDIFAALTGEDNAAVKFLDSKIAVQGRDEPVLADPTQMMLLLASMLNEGVDDNDSQE